jgi:aurora kinase
MLIQCKLNLDRRQRNFYRYFRNTTACGTLDYLAPEIVGHKQYQYQVDNWCVGVLAYELLSGRAPFEGTDDETKVKIANINYTFPDYFSQLARRFIDNVRYFMKIY